MDSGILDLKEQIEKNLTLLNIANNAGDKKWAEDIKKNLTDITDNISIINRYRTKIKRLQKFYE